MRHLVYWTLGFTYACLWGAYELSPQAAAVGAGAVLLLSALAGRKARPLRRIFLTALGCAAGLCWFSCCWGPWLSGTQGLNGATKTVTIRAMDFSRETDYGISVDGMMEWSGKRYFVRTYLDTDDPAEPGMMLTGPFRFRLTTPGGERDSLYLRSRGVFLLAYQADEVTRTASPPTGLEKAAILRKNIRKILGSCLSGDALAFSEALFLGDTSELSYEMDTNLKVSGIRHIVAVSGLHVSILFALVSFVTLRKRWLTAALGFPALLLFAAVAGFSPSVTRACIMTGLMLLAIIAGREYDGPTALAFSVHLILLANPFGAASASLQLSVLSVAGIYLFVPGIHRWITGLFGEVKGRSIKGRLVRWFAASVSISLSTMITTTPLCAWYFGTVSLAGPLTNLLVLWAVSLVFYTLAGMCLGYLLWPALGALLAKFAAILIRYILLVSQTIASFPLAAVYTASPYITAWLVFVYVLLVFFLASSNRKPVTLGCCAFMGLCLALLASWQEPRLEDLRFTVLDVGQGQCLLLQSEGKLYMIDCGGDSDTAVADLAAETLLSQGITKLDGLILTHLDRDHAGAAANLLSRIDTDILILPPVRTELADLTEGKVLYAEENLEICYGESKISIYAPIFPGNSNEMSLCLLLDTKKCDILVTGDRNAFGERTLLRYEAIPDVDILMAGHHGSRNSTSEELLWTVQPEVVCISVGAGNSYGHPAPEVLQRLRSHGCAVYRTDQHGTITIRR